MRKHTIPIEDLKKDGSRRSRLILEKGYVCDVCKLTEWMGKSIPVEIDHIDGNCENNVRENLRLICPNCHAQTDTYKGKNMGKNGVTARALRMKKYGQYRKIEEKLGS